MATRKYEQRERALTAEQTRRRILDTMRERLRAAPAEALRIDVLAGAAGVARSTVYAIFGSRTGLFEALGRDLLESAGFARVVAAVQLPDVRAALRESLRAASEVYAAERDVARVLFSMARLDPEAVAGAVEALEHGRTEGMRHLAGRLKRQGVLHAGTSVKEAADILWVVTSFETFDQLYTERGLSTA
jgi:AcrR family transcriptional regulator